MSTEQNTPIHTCVTPYGTRVDCAGCAVHASERVAEAITAKHQALEATPEPLDLIAIEARAEAATRGPWRVCAEGSEGSRIAPDYGDKRTRTRFIAIANGRVQPEDGCNARFIAAARSDVPALVAEVRRLRADRDRYRQSLPAEAQDYWYWRQRAETAEARVDGQAWAELSAERDRLQAALNDALADSDQLGQRTMQLRAEAERLHIAGHAWKRRADDATADLDAARAEMAEVTADRDHHRSSAQVMHRRLQEVIDDRDRLAGEVERLRALVGAEGQEGWDGVSRAGAIRQAEEKHELSQRLFTALETVKAELSTARRDAAADAFEAARRMPDAARRHGSAAVRAALRAEDGDPRKALARLDRATISANTTEET
jgi:hypothetical protein